MRYTMATGEPIMTGFMRTRPHSTFWAWFYATFYFLQMGWPGWAGAGAGAVLLFLSKALPGRRRCGRDLLSVHKALAGRRRVRDGLRDRSRTVSVMRTHFDDWTSYRTHTRVSQLDHARGHHRRPRIARNPVRTFIDVGCGRGRIRGLRRTNRLVSIRACRRRLLFARRVCCLRGSGRCCESDVEQLGARQRLRHEQQRRFHSRSRWREESCTRSLRNHFRTKRGVARTLARLVANRARGSVGDRLRSEERRVV